MKPVLLVMLLLVLVSPARAAVIEIPLPGLHGAYPLSPSNGTRTVTFQLPQVPDVIHGASFRIAGTVTVGLMDCGTPGVLDEWPMEFIANMYDTPGNLWLAWEPPSFDAGEFTWTAVFEPFPETTTWGFLMDGEGEISLYGAPTGHISCEELLAPAGTVTEAVLIIDADFPTPVEPTTWGKVKALYRR